MSEITVIPGPETSRDYRDALGCFGTGITVITTQFENRPLAMTVNSFASVSLDPAMVLWCASKKSQRYDAFANAGSYAIHVLADHQQPLAHHFARTGFDFSSVDWHPNEDGLPILNGSLARFECQQSALHNAGDHSIIVGKVVRAAHRKGRGLFHTRGKFGSFSEQL